jgi:hypothetical protein
LSSLTAARTHNLALLVIRFVVPILPVISQFVDESLQLLGCHSLTIRAAEDSSPDFPSGPWSRQCVSAVHAILQRLSYLFDGDAPTRGRGERLPQAVKLSSEHGVAPLRTMSHAKYVPSAI